MLSICTQILMDKNARKVRNQDINPCIEVSRQFFQKNVCFFLFFPKCSKYSFFLPPTFRKLMPPRSVWIHTTTTRACAQHISRDIRIAGNTGWVYDYQQIRKETQEPCLNKELALYKCYLLNLGDKDRREAWGWGSMLSITNGTYFQFPSLWLAYADLWVWVQSGKALVIDFLVTPTGWSGHLHNKGQKWFMGKLNCAIGWCSDYQKCI